VIALHIPKHNPRNALHPHQGCVCGFVLIGSPSRKQVAGTAAAPQTCFQPHISALTLPVVFRVWMSFNSIHDNVLKVEES
jgi:hypothetical protein